MALLKISTDKRIKSNGSELSDSFFCYKKCSSDDYEHSFHLSVNSIFICSGFALLPISKQIKSEVKTPPIQTRLNAYFSLHFVLTKYE